MGLVLAILAFLIPLAFSPLSCSFGYEDAFEIKRTVLEVGALTLLWFGSEKKLFNPQRLAKQPGYVFGLVFLAVLALHAIWLDPSRIPTRRLYESFCFMLIFLAAGQTMRDEQQANRIFLAMCVAGILVSSWGIFQFFRGIEPYSTLGNRNFFATFLLVVLATSVHFLRIQWKAGRFRWIAFHAINAALAVALLIACKSKAAWVAVAFAVLLLLLVQGRIRLLALGVIACAAMMAIFPVEGLILELGRDVRPYLWQGAWRLAMTSPFIGTGSGMFFVHLPPHRSPDYFLMDKAADTTFHAHNAFLEIFAETGLLGLVLFVAMIGCVLFVLIRKIRERQAGSWGSLTLFVLVALLAKSFFDMDLETISSGFLFWLFLGLAVASSVQREEPPPDEKARFLPRFSTFILIGILLWQLTIPYAVAQWEMNEAGQAQRKAQWVLAQQRYQKAWDAEPCLVEIPFRLGYAYARTGRWDEAIACYQAVRKIAPYYSNVLFNLALMFRQKGDYAKAMAYLREGFLINPYSISGHHIAREIFLLTNQPEKARNEETILWLLRGTV